MSAWRPALAKPVKAWARVNFDPPGLAANSTANYTFTVRGAQTSDTVLVIPRSLEAGLVVSHAWVSAKDTVSVRIGNVTTGIINPADQAFEIIIL